MELNRQKEQFGDAFLHAAAAAAGFATCKPGVDDDSVDWVIQHSGGGGLVRSPRIEVQLKCTACPEADTSDVKDWLRMTDDQLVLRNCAYWTSLRGLPHSDNISSIVVRFPREQRFDADALGNLMGRVASGVFP